MATFVGSESADDAVYVNAVYDQMYGLGGNDTLATNFAGTAALFGGNGDDRVYFLESVSGYVYGGAGNDFASGGSFVDVVFGESGNDLVSGGPSSLNYNASGYYDVGPVLIVVIGPVPGAYPLASGSDYLYGGDADDGIYGFDGDDVLYGGDGNDSGIVSGIFDATISMSLLPFKAGLFGGSGHDFLDGGAGNDLLEGGEGHDRLSGGGGNDIMHGGTEADVLYDVAGFDQAYGGPGDDSIFGLYASAADGSIIANGGGGVDLIVGGAGADILVGGEGVDSILGGGGSDTVIGGADGDFIIGGSGSDYYYGGDGIDYFNLLTEVIAGDADYLLDAATDDIILLPASATGAVLYFSYGAYAFGYVPVSGGYYLFGASTLGLAELQAIVTYY